MWCTERTQVSKFDETINVKGCLGKVLPKKLKKVTKTKSKTLQTKSPLQKSRVRPVCGVSPRQAIVSPRRAVILKNAWEAESQEDKENVSPAVVRPMPKQSAVTQEKKISGKTILNQDKLKGELRIGFHMNGRIVIVQVIEARKLHIEDTYTFGDGFYVTLSLVPKDDDQTRDNSSTRIVFDKNPCFNEEFSMELMQKDEKKRLVVTVNRINKKIDEVIGSFSFGIKSLVQKSRQQSGWYYVLEHSLGQKKHLRLTQAENLSKLANLTGVSGLSALDEQSQVNIVRSLSDVSVSPTVSEMISVDQLSVKYPTKPTVKYPFATPMQRMNSTQKLQSPTDTTLPSELETCSLSAISLYDLTSSPGDALFRRNPVQQTMETTEESEQYETTAEGEDSSLKWTMHTTEAEDTTGEGQKLMHVEEKCWQIVADLDQYRDNKSYAPDTSVTYNTMTTFNSMSVTIASAKDDTNYVSPTSGYGCQMLLEAQYDFLTKMQFGVQCFSRPLRYCMLTPHEHNILFQNCEKIMAIAEFHFKKLSESFEKCLEKGECASARISSVYKPQLALMAEAYISYIRGMKASKHLLTSLLAEGEFQRFIQKSTRGQRSVTMEMFLEAPRKHLRELVAAFEAIISDLSTHDNEYQELHDIFTALINCWEMSMGSHASQCEPKGNTYVTQQNHHRYKECNSVSASTLCNVDSELLLLQQRLQFASHVEPFQLAVPGRHIVYSGELCYVNGWKWVNAWVVLMNDMMIICEDATTDRVRVIADPVYMADVCTAEFDCLHPSEFVLSLNEEKSSICAVTFRSSCPELKITWRHLLEQRVAYCQNQREYSL